MPVREPPAAVTAPCPGCGETTTQSVLKGTMAERGESVTIDATVQCTECDRVHHVVVREAKDIHVPVVLSAGGKSRKTSVPLAPEEDVQVEDVLIVEGVNSQVSGIETKDGKRVEAATAREVQTLWMKEFERLTIGYAINLGHKTIVKTVPAEPEAEFTVGEERVFGRLRVTVHAIKTKERLLKRGTAEAAEIVRVFAKPTPLSGPQHRPDKRTREQMREREERRSG